MKPRLLEILVCPECHGDLGLAEHGVYSHGELRNGNLLCTRCGRAFPVVNYVPRFVPEDAYVGSFSFEWKKFASTQYGLQTEQSFSRFNISVQELPERRILDVGCGSGRFIEFFSRHGAEAVGVDLSYSVDEAFAICGLRPNVHILQASLFKMPFKQHTFDLVFSFGVLMCTPNTKRAFMELPRYVTLGGKLAIFVYSKRSESGFWAYRTKEQLSDLYRSITSRVPHALLYLLSYLSIPLYDLKRVPKLGRLIDAAVESSDSPDWRTRVLETFDWYSPRYQWKHSNHEVAQWFEEAGFTGISICHHPITIVGVKPNGVR